MKLLLSFLPFFVMSIAVGIIGTELGTTWNKAQIIGVATILLWFIAGEAADWLKGLAK